MRGLITIVTILGLLQFNAQSQEFLPMQEKEIVTSDCSTDCCRTLPDRLPMTYVYYQKTGRFVGGSGEYKIDTHGYSGQGKGYLNPDEQCTPSVGPLPASVYKLSYCKNKMH